MKTLTFFVSILAAMLISNIVMASNTDSTRVEKKIIKTVMITDDGKIMIDSTFIMDGDQVSVHVDSIMRNCKDPNFKYMKGKRCMNWNDEEGDEYEVNIEMVGDSTRSIITKNPKIKHKVMKYEGSDIPKHKKMMILNDTEGMPCPPPPPLPPLSGCFSHQQGMIDLNDPSIISYEKKLQKDGTEKITIIRKTE